VRIVENRAKRIEDVRQRCMQVGAGVLSAGHAGAANKVHVALAPTAGVVEAGNNGGGAREGEGPGEAGQDEVLALALCAAQVVLGGGVSLAPEGEDGGGDGGGVEQAGVARTVPSPVVHMARRWDVQEAIWLERGGGEDSGTSLVLSEKGSSQTHDLELQSAYGDYGRGHRAAAGAAAVGASEEAPGASRAAAAYYDEPETTNYTGSFSGTLDYIFWSPGLRRTGVMSLPTREVLQRHTALPSADWPSDHLALAASFAFPRCS
jgi:hypothetical protein